MIKIALIDQQFETFEKVNVILSKKSYLKPINRYSSFNDFVEESAFKKCHLVLVSLQQHCKDCLEVGEKIYHLNSKIPIIFLANTYGSMKEAFGINIHDYILKKNIDKELAISIERLMDIVIKNKEIIVKSKMGEINVSIKNIIFVRFESRRPVIYTNKNMIVVYGSPLYSIYEKLPKKFFSYANSGTIVNYAYIATIKKNVIEMKHSQELITISRGNKKKIIKKFNEFMVLES